MCKYFQGHHNGTPRIRGGGRDKGSDRMGEKKREKERERGEFLRKTKKIHLIKRGVLESRTLFFKKKGKLFDHFLTDVFLSFVR